MLIEAALDGELIVCAEMRTNRPTHLGEPGLNVISPGATKRSPP